MKIGILTFVAVPNFGANLQALSTYCYLKNKGHSPIIINWVPKEDDDYFRKLCLQNKQSACHLEFVKKVMKFTEWCDSEKDVAHAVKKYDIEAVIVGSDAVLQHHPLFERMHFSAKRIFWIHKMSKSRLFPNPFWGGFQNELEKKIPMALMSVSSQGSQYKYIGKAVRKKMAASIEMFSYISVRDEWTQKMISHITNEQVIPPVTPDPVFAFDYNCHDLLPAKTDILEKYNLPEKYILFSLLHRNIISYEWMEELKKIAKTHSLPVVVLPMPTGVDYKHPFNKEIPCPLSPLDWYALIKYSSGYIGQNMHPTIVALANDVPVFCFDSYVLPKFFGMFANEKASKVYHILTKFGHKENRCSVGYRKASIPSPHIIFEKLNSFDKEKSHLQSSEYLKQYLSMMSSIENTLQQ